MGDLERPSLSCLSPNCVSPIPLHVSLIPLSLLFPCLSHSYVSLTPMYLPFSRLSHSPVSLISMSLFFPCLSHSPVSLIHLSLSFPCLSHSPVSLIVVLMQSKAIVYKHCFTMAQWMTFRCLYVSLSRYDEQDIIHGRTLIFHFWSNFLEPPLSGP